MGGHSVSALWKTFNKFVPVPWLTLNVFVEIASKLVDVDVTKCLLVLCCCAHLRYSPKGRALYRALIRTCTGQSAHTCTLRRAPAWINRFCMGFPGVGG